MTIMNCDICNALVHSNLHLLYCMTFFLSVQSKLNACLTLPAVSQLSIEHTAASMWKMRTWMALGGLLRIHGKSLEDSVVSGKLLTLRLVMWWYSICGNCWVWSSDLHTDDSVILLFDTQMPNGRALNLQPVWVYMSVMVGSRCECEFLKLILTKNTSLWGGGLVLTPTVLHTKPQLVKKSSI